MKKHAANQRSGREGHKQRRDVHEERLTDGKEDESDQRQTTHGARCQQNMRSGIHV
jgi:hypothetical protein